jgi:hypothetical protein
LVIRSILQWVLFRSLELWTFQRYPVITEMEDTYWIDGIYNGKFASGYGASLYIIGLMPVDGCKVGNVVLTFQNNPLLIINSYRVSI